MFAATTLALLALQIAGAIAVLVALFRVARFVSLNLLTKTNVKARYGKAGDWAVVTGASAGIGEAYALELARRGFNVVVIARRRQVLDDLCKTITADFKVQAKAVEFDFATESDAAYKRLFAELSGLRIAILVNNVGLSYPNYQPYAQLPVQQEIDILNVNCQSVLRLTHFVLPQMRQARAGAVITVSSTYGSLPAPYLGAYGATKAFGSHFSYSLGLENKEFGIDFQAVCPMFVFTAMAKAKKPTGMMVMPRDVAAGSLNRLGAAYETVGTLKQELLVAVLSVLPRFLVDSISLSQSTDFYKRFQKKQAAEAAATGVKG
jgi:17beta-estradiol 17-dehydrogenase / very-long-chain 3-oxoacyl-CoA reductase